MKGLKVGKKNLIAIFLLKKLAAKQSAYEF
jgi:hypothetical protein